MSKFFYNRATTRICAKKPFITIGKFSINNFVLYFPGWTNLRTTIKTEILPLNVVKDQLVTFFGPSECLSAKICCSWSSDKFAKRATWEFFSALFLFLVGSGPKRAQQDLYRASALHCKYDFHIFTAIIHHFGGLTWHEEVVLAPRVPSYIGVPGEAQL